MSDMNKHSSKSHFRLSFEALFDMTNTKRNTGVVMWLSGVCE